MLNCLRLNILLIDKLFIQEISDFRLCRPLIEPHNHAVIE